MKITREEWLIGASYTLEKHLFSPKGYPDFPKYRVSCSLPSKGAFASKLRRIGEAWHSSSSADGTCEIFISPTIADSQLVAATLAHELVHVCVGNAAAHGPIFRKCALAIGLEGKMTATTASKDLNQFITDNIIQVLGNFPHAVLDQSQVKKQTTRMLKAVCLNSACSFQNYNSKPYSVRISQSTYNYAAPVCGCCDQTMSIN